MLQGVFGEKEVGIYAAMYQIANAPMTLLFGMINQFAMPIIFEHAGAMSSDQQQRRSRRAMYQTVSVTSIILAVPVVVAYFYGADLIALIATREFAEQHTALWILVLGLSLFNIAQLLTVHGFTTRQTSIYILPKGVHAASFLVFAFLLTRPYGVIGVAIATALASLLYLLAVMLVNKTLPSGSNY
jgi:O-antigen/teichoic acid export membrane protein